MFDFEKDRSNAGAHIKFFILKSQISGHKRDTASSGSVDQSVPEGHRFRFGNVGAQQRGFSTRLDLLVPQDKTRSFEKFDSYVASYVCTFSESKPDNGLKHVNRGSSVITFLTYI